MMKKIIFICASLFFSFGSIAQKYGYVNTQYIIEKMPEYSSAQQEIEKLASGWQDEVQKGYKEAEKMEMDLKAEKVLLTVEMIADREKKIEKKLNEVRSFQQSVFGFEGLYFLKKKELIKPVQDLIFTSVEKVAKKHKLQTVFDKSGDPVIIYSNPIHDYTDFVMEDLGLIEKLEEKN